MSEPKSPEDEALAQPADLVTTDGEPPQIDTDTLQSEDSATNPQVQEMRLWAQYSNFQGPLPHPSTMEDYKKKGSDFPERIVAAWEAETQHRRELEKGDQELQMRPFELAAAGQKMAYSLAIRVFWAVSLCPC